MKWRQAVPTSVTIVAMLSGFLSILVTMEGIRTGEPYPYYRWAAQLIMLAMILDGIDGNVARALRGQSEFGGELDTYVDMTAFGIAPAILIFAVTLH
ncbi:MAG: CDP-alcohol phosphatidyltransferase family protein, partial [Kiritimatiellia bacterium]|nr:CDP-alcohol phosphatidyltransferase family protein [Kiritimatiellia bacterium]